MRPPRLWLVVALFFCFAITLVAQSQSSSSPQALTTLQSAFQALSGRTVIKDITLTGTAEWIAGSDDETGTAVLKTTTGANRLDLSLSGGTRSEIRSSSASGPVGSWIGPDGVSHNMALHNLMTDPGWVPLFALSNISSSPNSFLVYVGQEIRNGASVIHLSASQQFQSSTDPNAPLLQHLTQSDIYLNASTLLPVSFVYNTHPDNNALDDAPTEIRYLAYKNIDGVQVPVHLQKFINNSLTLDLQFQNVSLNTGITAAQINGQ